MPKLRSLTPLSETESPYFVGVDVGGTSVKFGLVDNQGQTPLHCLSTLPMDAFELMLDRYPAAASVTDNNGMLPLHAAVDGTADSDLVRILLEANPLSVLKTTRRGLTPLQIVASLENYGYDQMETRDLLVRKQDETVRLIRDTILSEAEEVGLPDLVVSTICSFILPKILNPIEDELKW